MKSVFVTGGTGFLGLNIVEQLRQADVNVHALHRASSDVTRLRSLGAQLVEGSLTSSGGLVAAIPEGCDAVFHVAGNTSLWSGDRDAQTRDNVDGTRLMVEAAIARKAKCFVYTSSISAFGAQPPPSYDETSPSAALTSRSNYERSKYLAELEVLKGVERGLRAVILNPGSMLGRYDTRSWARVIMLVDRGKLPGAPSGFGAFCGGAQVARAHLSAVEKGRTGERYILAGTETTLFELVQLIGKRLGKKVPGRPTPLPLLRALAWASELGSHVTKRAPTLTPEGVGILSRSPSTPSSEKAKRELAYETVPLEELVDTACEWLRAEGLIASGA